MISTTASREQHSVSIGLVRPEAPWGPRRPGHPQGNCSENDR